MTLPIAAIALRVKSPVSTLQGESDSLAAINTTELPDNALVMVQASNTLYILNKDSVATEDSPNIIAPDQGGPGRWFRYGPGGGYFQSVSIAHATIPPQSGIDSSPVGVTGVDGSANDVISYNLLDSGLNSGIAMGPPRITAADTAVWRLANVGAATVSPGSISVRVMVSNSQ